MQPGAVFMGNISSQEKRIKCRLEYNNMEKKKFHLPHIYVLLVTFIIVCAVATWVLPAGEFDREANASGAELVVPGT